MGRGIDLGGEQKDLVEEAGLRRMRWKILI